MIKNNKYVIYIASLCCLVLIVFFVNTKISANKSSSVLTESQNKQTQVLVDELRPGNIATQKINIGHGCIGCGKCARIDPEHFSLRGRQATVISSENLNSSSLSRAISSCPVGVISL